MKIRVFAMDFIVAGQVAITFKDGASTSLSGAYPMVAFAGMTKEYTGDPWFETTSGNAFVLNLSAAIAVTGFLRYEKVPA